MYINLLLLLQGNSTFMRPISVLSHCRGGHTYTAGWAFYISLWAKITKSKPNHISMMYRWIGITKPLWEFFTWTKCSNVHWPLRIVSYQVAKVYKIRAIVPLDYLKKKKKCFKKLKNFKKHVVPTLPNSPNEINVHLNTFVDYLKFNTNNKVNLRETMRVSCFYTRTYIVLLVQCPYKNHYACERS